MSRTDFSGSSRTLAFMLSGDYAKGALMQDDDIYMAMNMHWKGHRFELPPLPEGKSWYSFANTSKPRLQPTPGSNLCDPSGTTTGRVFAVATLDRNRTYVLVCDI